MTGKELDILLDKIAVLLVAKGPKSLTMDHVAAECAISKRTLYEIFGSKNEMVIRVLNRKFEQQSKALVKILDEAPDMMTCFIRIFAEQQKNFGRIKASFFKDMDTYFRELRDNYDYREAEREKMCFNLYNIGVRDGVFREGINFPLALKMLNVQFEALVRSEEIFPADITVAEIYGAVMESFLRSIASRKGLDIIERQEIGKEKQTDITNEHHN